MTKMMQPVRGTFDLLGDHLLKHRAIQNLAIETAGLFGYEEIITPIFEYTHVFTKPLGETSDIVGKEMYTFSDRGGESITLRPEGTAPVLRALLSEGLTQTMPQRRIMCGSFFRYERPQKGRYRQFHQISVECIGIESFHADVEVISLAHMLLKKVGVPHISLHLNTLGDMESRRLYRLALVAYFSSHKDQLSHDSLQRLEKNPLRILDSKDEGDQAISSNAPKIQDFLSDASRLFFQNLCESLDALGIAYVVDPTLVRGMDYYCHTVFEFKSNSLGAQDTVLGGGRYDGLMEQMGGPSTPAVGFGCGMERLALISENLHLAQDVPHICFVPMGNDEANFAQKLAYQLRAQGVFCEILLSGKVGKRLAAAVKKNAYFTAVIGSDEMQDQMLTIRSLRLEEGHPEKDQKIACDALASYLLHNVHNLMPISKRNDSCVDL